MKNYILILILSLFAVSCKTKNVATNPVDQNSASSSGNFFTMIKEKPNFQQIKINSKVNVENGSFIPTLDATIYIENGQKVWMNMVAVILNVARGVATPEGIMGYEKLNKTYIESDFSYLNNLLNVNFIDFNSLQNLLIGKTFVPIGEKDFVLSKNAQGFQLKSLKNLKFENNGETSEYSVTMNYSSNYDLVQVNLEDKDKTNSLEISYLNWTTFENMKLPKNVKIIIKGTKTSQILLENTRFESLKMDTPYSVPNNYKKTEIR